MPRSGASIRFDGVRRSTSEVWGSAMTGRRVAVLAGAVSLAVAAAVPAGAASAPGLADPIPGRLPVAPVTVGVHTVADGFVSPTGATVAPGVRDRLYVTDQTGKVYAVDISKGGGGRKTLFADLSGLLVKLGNVVPGTRYDERGLLGLAFSPDYQQNGLVYTYQTEPYGRRADFSTEPGNSRNCRAYSAEGTRPFSPRPCQNVVTEWHVKSPRTADARIDPKSARELLRIDKPFFNHNAGTLAFGPDGDLYISVGDGGFGDDQGPGHVNGGNAQSLAPGNVLGKILRIDPRGRNSANGRYGIPRDNPFVGRRGADEIYAYGLRNPYRFSFDPVSGRLYAGDTGQDNIEEIDAIRAGGNYGWRVKEGTFLFHPNSPGNADDSFVSANSPGLPAGLIDPIAEYDHTGPNDTVNGEAVIGGYVYRGSAVPQLAGRYVFGDYSKEADTFGPAGRLWLMNGNKSVTHRVTLLRVRGSGDLNLLLLGFARDAKGELYVLGNRTGTLASRTGVVERITR